MDWGVFELQGWSQLLQAALQGLKLPRIDESPALGNQQSATKRANLQQTSPINLLRLEQTAAGSAFGEIFLTEPSSSVNRTNNTNAAQIVESSWCEPEIFIRDLATLV